MIMLKRVNNEKIVGNSAQIQMVEMIPESKVVMANKEFFVVLESADQIIRQIVAFQARVFAESGIMLVKQQEDE